MAFADWGREYIRLALRMEKLFPGFVDGYFGPPELKAEIDAEPVPTAAGLLRDAALLADALPAQGYEPRRATYLHKQVGAMELTCRKLAGEAVSLADEVRLCFDIQPEWTPEAEFEEALAIYEATLPGDGNVEQRLGARRNRYELGPEKAHLVQGLMEQAMAEVRRRTLTFVDLPEGEGVTMKTVTGQPWGAYNWYLGNYRSAIELNTDLPTNASGLLEMMAHEGYPGHHVEHVLKEHLLYRGKGYLEQSILLINTPECVISEGIATLAAEMVFGPGEAREWLAQEVFPTAGIEPEYVDQAKLNRAAELLAGVRGNAVIMLHGEGRPDDEVIRYLVKYGLLPEERARKSMSFLKSPLWRAYTFTYFYGRRLMLPLLQGEDRLHVFRRLLTEQVYPSLLLEWAKPS
ncbi:MAG TPA: hypothetical protein VNT75_02490 [Symbiobacteriaceae bacterium]|nr:hypothetical protein [Symbiobacteriaceae bacterium]